MPVIGGPMSLKEADEALAGPLGVGLGFKRTKDVLPWTTVGGSIRKPPDTDQAVEIFVEANKNVRECWEMAVKTFAPQGREYFVYHDYGKEVVRFSYAQAARQVEQIAWSLKGLGVGKGDRVGIAMRNFPEYLPAWWAIICIGAVAVPLNAWLVKEELDWCIKDCGAKVLVIDQERLDRLGEKGGLGLKDTAAPNGGVEHFILVRSKIPAGLAAAGISAIPFEKLVDPNAPAGLPAADISPYDNVMIMYSSGTTGRPKGVLYHHLSLAQQAHANKYAAVRTALRTGMDVPANPPQITWILPVPLFHLTGIGYSFLGTCAGCRHVYVNKWDASEGIEIIHKDKVTHFMGVPTQALQLLESPSFSKEKLASLVFLGYGGAPGPAALRSRAKAAFGRPGFGEPSNGYGATESLAISANSGEDFASKPDSVGNPPAYLRVEIRDEDGTVLPPNSVGEIWVKGFGIAKGYWNNEKATAASFQRGYYMTGDIGRLDNDGFLYIEDRSKDMLIRGGENVYSLEIQNALLTHPAVMDAAVFGIPHRVLGEEVAASVRLTPSMFGKVTSEELRQHLSTRLAKFKIPAFIDLVNEPLPANPAGKILKRQLREEVGSKAAKALGGDFAAKL